MLLLGRDWSAHMGASLAFCEVGWAAVTGAFSSKDVTAMFARLEDGVWVYAGEVWWTAAFVALDDNEAALRVEFARARGELTALGLPQRLVDGLVPDLEETSSPGQMTNTTSTPIRSQGSGDPSIFCLSGVPNGVLAMRDAPRPDGTLVFMIEDGQYTSCNIYATQTPETVVDGDRRWYFVQYADHAFVRDGWVDARYVSWDMVDPCFLDVDLCGQ